MATTYSHPEVAVSDVRAAAGVNDAMLAVGRVLIAILFVMSGLEKVMDIPGTAAAIGGKGLPMPDALAVATVVVELGGGLLIIVGWQTRIVALVLALFTAVAAYFFLIAGLRGNVDTSLAKHEHKPRDEDTAFEHDPPTHSPDSKHHNRNAAG